MHAIANNSALTLCSHATTRRRRRGEWSLRSTLRLHRMHSIHAHVRRCHRLNLKAGPRTVSSQWTVHATCHRQRAILERMQGLQRRCELQHGEARRVRVSRRRGALEEKRPRSARDGAAHSVRWFTTKLGSLLRGRFLLLCVARFAPACAAQ